MGLICTGYARVDGEDRPNAGMMGIYDDAFIPQYQELTRRVHAYGAKIMMQIAYGGSPANRYRIVGDIIAAIRQAAGLHFPIWIKITCSDFFEGGLTFEDSLDICRRLQQSGIDAIEVSGNIHGKAQQEIGLEWDGHVIRDGGYFLDYAKDIADAVRVPVYVTGGFKDPRQMETALKTSKLAGIGLSRPLLSEPSLVRRWNQGDLRPARCVHCSKCRTPEGNYCTVFAAIDAKKGAK